jgi:hypothetical protein
VLTYLTNFFTDLFIRFCDNFFNLYYSSKVTPHKHLQQAKEAKSSKPREILNDGFNGVIIFRITLPLALELALAQIMILILACSH